MSPIYEYFCDCGKTEESFSSIEKRNDKTCKCGKVMKIKISKPLITNCDSFNPHYDMQQGEYFSSAAEKKEYLTKNGLTQTEGSMSPKRSTKARIICNCEQAKLMDSNTSRAKKVHSDLNKLGNKE